MCTSCGCGDPHVMPFDVHERILAGNDRAARHNREHFRDHHVIAVNLMGSPGAGKTAVLEATARELGRTGEAAKVGVLGDLGTDNDAVRLRAVGLMAQSITTGTACHLDAEMVHRGLHNLPWRTFDYLFIENVGNLVCPAIYDLGQDVNVVALSVTEGEDKPLKYPMMFHKADLVLLTKIASVMPVPRLLKVTQRTGEGIADWVRWLNGRRRPRTAACAASAGAGAVA